MSFSPIHAFKGRGFHTPLVLNNKLMNKFIAFSLTLLLCLSVNAQSLFEQLSAFNPNWEKYKDKIPQKEAIYNLNEKQIVQLHLSFVLNILKENSASYPTEIKRKRRDLISLLEEYKNLGRFPINYQLENRVPVFIDSNDTHCAVAYLIKNSAKPDLAYKIARNYNLNWLKDIANKELLEWQKSSGLSLEELKIIQGAYDNYSRDGRSRWDRYEIPQEPQVGIDYFNKNGLLFIPKDSSFPKGIWLKGEGENGILNGKWIQNAANGKLWIVGYFSKGQRTGQWKEYYKGTKILCRTENWKNHKLHGLRKRFNRNGKLIEIIDFKNGLAVSKINFDLEKGLKYIRIPLENSRMKTEIYNETGRLLASGIEKINNPGNLEWFQDIELTALNQFALDAKMQEIPIYQFGIHRNFNARSYQNQSLVKYLKQGQWIYYRESWTNAQKDSLAIRIILDYPHLAKEIYASFYPINPMIKGGEFDSILVNYEENRPVDLIAANSKSSFHLHREYFPNDEKNNQRLSKNVWRAMTGSPLDLTSNLALQGEYDKEGQKVGLWKYFNKNGELYRLEDYSVENYNPSFFPKDEIVFSKE
tara:strand:+ start:13368 stop:15128 length:1761 start_codon:yes stop_codon:yes gene_type:complete